MHVVGAARRHAGGWRLLTLAPRCIGHGKKQGLLG